MVETFWLRVVIVVVLYGVLHDVAVSQPTAFRECMVVESGESSGSIVYLPGEDGYRERMRWTFQPDPSDVPVAFVDAGNETDIRSAILCARQLGYGVCPRGGGHSRIGSGLCSGIVVDVGRMSYIKYSGDNTSVTIGVGLTLGKFATQLYTEARKVFPVGSCPSVGISGFILAGGLSKISSKLGFGSDNLEEVKIVLANGKIITANSTDRPNLLWASRGGGGGRLGIVYEMRLRVHDSNEFDAHVGFSGTIKGKENIVPFLTWYFQWRDGGNTVSRVKMIWKRSSEPVIQINGACLNTEEEEGCKLNLESQGLYNFSWESISLLKGTTALGLLNYLNADSGNFLEDGALYSRGQEVRETNAVSAISFRYNLSTAYPRDEFFGSTLDLIGGLLCSTSMTKFSFIVQSMAPIITDILPTETPIWGFRKSTHWISFRIESPSLQDSFQQLVTVKSFFEPHSYGSFLNYEDPTLTNYTEGYFGSNQLRLIQTNMRVDPTGVFLSKQPLIQRIDSY